MPKPKPTPSPLAQYYSPTPRGNNVSIKTFPTWNIVKKKTYVKKKETVALLLRSNSIYVCLLSVIS